MAPAAHYDEAVVRAWSGGVLTLGSPTLGSQTTTGRRVRLRPGLHPTVTLAFVVAREERYAPSGIEPDGPSRLNGGSGRVN